MKTTTVNRTNETMHLTCYEDVLFEVSKGLTDKEKNSVCWNTLCNMHASESLLEKLAKDTREWVRICVAAHPNTSRETLKYLASA